MNNINSKRKFALSAITAVLAITFCGSARADVITEWNQNAQQALLTAKASPAVSTRVLAIVQVAVFDAVNGIERRYTPIHADFDPPAGASRRAAAIQAAYDAFVRFYPSQQATLDAERQASLALIASGEAADDSQSIGLGTEWGQTVAGDILLWRSTDGFSPAPPSFLGGTAVGEWRPTPPAFLPGAVPQFAYMTMSVADERHLTLSEKARLLALEAKYTYVFWRPITAIRLASTDGNPNTTEDPAWTPLLITPNFPEYPSGYPTVSPAAATVLGTYFGNDDFTLKSETVPGVVRYYSSFTQAADEAFNARIYGGIHFRSACRDGRALGTHIWSLVMTDVAQPIYGQRKGQINHNHPTGDIGAEGEIPSE